MCEYIEIAKALLTPLIACIATYIALQQWKTNRSKLRLERYDRRIKIYEEVVSILSIIIGKADISYEELHSFKRNTAEADFLFGDEIPEYIDEIFKSGVELRHWNEQYRDFSQQKPEGYDHELVVESKHKALNWLIKQPGPTKELFKKYLDLSDA